MQFKFSVQSQSRPFSDIELIDARLGGTLCFKRAQCSYFFSNLRLRNVLILFLRLLLFSLKPKETDVQTEIVSHMDRSGVKL